MFVAMLLTLALTGQLDILTFAHIQGQQAISGGPAAMAWKANQDAMRMAMEEQAMQAADEQFARSSRIRAAQVARRKAQLAARKPDAARPVMGREAREAQIRRNLEKNQARNR